MQHSMSRQRYTFGLGSQGDFQSIQEHLHQPLEDGPSTFSSITQETWSRWIIRIVAGSTSLVVPADQSTSYCCGITG